MLLRSRYSSQCIDHATILQLFKSPTGIRVSHGNTVCESSPYNLASPVDRLWFSAVKFIRDQAEAVASTEPASTSEKLKGPVNTAQAAATVLKRILTRDRNDVSIDVADDVAEEGVINPLVGWDEGVALQKRHFCLLLKPQIVLRSEGSPDFVSVLAAVQAKLQSFTILDKSNMEDPISGTIMTRYRPNFG